ncbi:hypothetical protein AAHC03_01549 [Spirometra sp. Aus1]
MKTVPPFSQGETAFLTKQSQIPERWLTHFQGSFHQAPKICEEATNRLPRLDGLDHPPSLPEVIGAMQQHPGNQRDASRHLPAKISWKSLSRCPKRGDDEDTPQKTSRM